MKKQKPKPTPATPDYLPACRKAGIATAFHFQRIIKHALQCTMPEAEKHFADAVQSGRIKEVGVNRGGDVKFYKTV